MRATLLLLVSLAVGAGCYRPDPASGSYLCGASEACPSGLVCECGQCVSAVGEAACSFEISAAGNQTALAVEEHERFRISVRARKEDGTTATRFASAVTLSSSWGDVCVGSSGCLGPSNKVKLEAGLATGIEVQLNRETISPQTAILRAEFATAVGTSGRLRINVSAPVFSRADPLTPGVNRPPIVAPLMTEYALLKPQVRPTTRFGSASVFAAAPSVIKRADGWRMYFVSGGVTSDDKLLVGTSVATSVDGRTFVPPTAPFFETDIEGKGTGTGAASALATDQGVSLFVGRGPARPLGLLKPALGYESLVRLRSAAADGPFSLTTATEVLSIPAMPGDPRPTVCAYCTALDVPSVIVDPQAALYGGGPATQLMFFSAIQPGKDEAGNDVSSISIVRATSLDGESFEIDPSPALRSTREEFAIYSPRVLVDGTVYKMFYSVVGFDPARPFANLSNPCDAPYHVGYATSTDGRFWIRSPRNSPPWVTDKSPVPPQPVLDVDLAPGSWEQAGSILVGSVLPVDGVDPSSGLALYYSPFGKIGPGGILCLPNGIGRADRR